MTLTPEQKATVATWLAAGDNLSQVQKKLREHFSVGLTYMDVRFLVDDLNLQIKDPPAKVTPPKDGGMTPAAGAQNNAGGVSPPRASSQPGPGAPAEPSDSDDFADAPLADDVPPAGASTVSVTVDAVTLTPGALASGGVTFSDGVTGKWIVDQYGRPGFTEVSQPGYRPTPADGQAFVQKLSAELQKKGF